MLRFQRSLHNLLNLFVPKVNQAQCYGDNGAIPELVFQQEGAIHITFHPDFFVFLQRKAQL